MSHEDAEHAKPNREADQRDKAAAKNRTEQTAEQFDRSRRSNCTRMTLTWMAQAQFQM